MNVKMPRKQEVIQEALEILVKHMEPAKVGLLLSMLQEGSGDYLEIREELFAGETMTTLLKKVKAYEQRKEQIS